MKESEGAPEGHRFVYYLNCADGFMDVYVYSVKFSRSVVSDSFRSHESQQARPPSSPTPGVHSDSRPSSR